MNTTSRRTRHAILAVAVSAPVLLAPAAFAGPAAARRPSPGPRPPSPPSVQFEPSWRFGIGGQVDRTTAGQTWYGDSRVFHKEVPVNLVWHAGQRHRAPIAGYDLFLTRVQTEQVLDNTTATSYRMLHTDLLHPIAPHPGRLVDFLNPRFRLVATDPAGRTTTVETQRHPLYFEQENGTTYLKGRTVFPSAPRTGRGWRTVNGTEYDGGSALATSLRGAFVRIPVTAHEGGQWVALEMSTGPRLGVVEVRVDGHRVGTVDTYHAHRRERVLVAEYRLDAGDHLVTLVNLGVRNRQTVRLDGVFASD